MKSLDFGEFYRNASSDEIGDVNLHGEMELVGERLVWEMFRRSTSGSALYLSKYRKAYYQLMASYRNKG